MLLCAVCAYGISSPFVPGVAAALTHNLHFLDMISWQPICSSESAPWDELAPILHARDPQLRSNPLSKGRAARPVHLIITMIKWIRTSRLSIKNSVSCKRASTSSRSLTLRDPSPLLRELLITRPARSQTKTPCGGCCSTRISVSLTHYTFFKKGEGGANTPTSGERIAPFMRDPSPLLRAQLPDTVHRARGGLVFKAHRLVYHSTLGARVIQKKRSSPRSQAVQAGCCNDKCKTLAATSTDCFDATNPTKTEAGCTGDDTDGDCFCSWAYTGEESTAAGCSSSDSGESLNWDCSAATTYETEGECQAPFELFGEMVDDLPNPKPETSTPKP